MRSLHNAFSLAAAEDRLRSGFSPWRGLLHPQPRMKAVGRKAGAPAAGNRHGRAGPGGRGRRAFLDRLHVPKTDERPSRYHERQVKVAGNGLS